MQLTEYPNTKWNSEFNWHNLQVRGGMGSLEFCIAQPQHVVEGNLYSIIM